MNDAHPNLFSPSPWVGGGGTSVGSTGCYGAKVCGGVCSLLLLDDIMSYVAPKECWRRGTLSGGWSKENGSWRSGQSVTTGVWME